MIFLSLGTATAACDRCGVRIALGAFVGGPGDVSDQAFAEEERLGWYVLHDWPHVEHLCPRCAPAGRAQAQRLEETYALPLPTPESVTEAIQRAEEAAAKLTAGHWNQKPRPKPEPEPDPLPARLGHYVEAAGHLFDARWPSDPEPTAEVKTQLRSAMDYMLSVCDGAATVDFLGFSAAHATLARDVAGDLAQGRKEAFTCAVRLLRHYPRQVRGIAPALFAGEVHDAAARR